MALASCVAETVCSGPRAATRSRSTARAWRTSTGSRRCPRGAATSSSSRSRSATSSSCTRSAPLRARPGLSAALGEPRSASPAAWKRLVEPALGFARRGPAAGDARAFARDGAGASAHLDAARISSSGTGRTLQEGEVLEQPGLVQRSRCSPTRVRRRRTAALSRRRCSQSRESSSPGTTCGDYSAAWRDPVVVASTGTGRDAGRVSPACPSSCSGSRLVGLSETERVLALVGRARDGGRGGEYTTNMVAVDGHGSACVLTHSLGVGAGV